MNFLYLLRKINLKITIKNNLKSIKNTGPKAFTFNYKVEEVCVNLRNPKLLGTYGWDDLQLL
jgi:hypothetical protein